jgi:hypothetical protein
VLPPPRVVQVVGVDDLELHRRLLRVHHACTTSIERIGKP